MPIVIANWKMNPVTLTEAKQIFNAVKTAVKKYPTTQIVVAAPHLYITELKKNVVKSSITLGAQNSHFDVKGAYTGEHSLQQLKDVGVTHVILGHSERRFMGETDEFVAKKIASTIKSGLIPILCVGEKERDIQGNFYLHIESQIKSSLSLLPKNKVRSVVIAYEPIWAIGTGKTATVADVQEMRLFIEKILTKHFDRPTAKNTAVIYGGSVNTENATELFKQTGVQGFLVGGASLKPDEFAKIIAAVN
jgi:triosephosphate isomerase